MYQNYNEIIISNVEKIDTFGANEIAKNISNILDETLSEFGISKETTFSSLMNLNMFYAQIDCKTQQDCVYKMAKNSIYFAKGLDLSTPNVDVINQVVHYLQAEVENGKLVRMGLMKMPKFWGKVQDYEMNEAAVQYFACHVCKKKPTEIKLYGMELTTYSEDKLAIQTSLISQLVYFTGTYPLFNSILFSTDVFKDTFEEMSDKYMYEDISSKFEQIKFYQEQLKSTYSLLEFNQKESKKVALLDKITTYKQNIKEVTLQAQQNIYSSVLLKELENVQTIQDILNTNATMSNISNYIIQTQDYYAYEQFKSKMQQELKSKYVLIETYGNYSFALKAKKDVANLPKVYSLSLVNTLFSKIKMLVELKLKNRQFSKDSLYE